MMPSAPPVYPLDAIPLETVDRSSDALQLHELASAWTVCQTAARCFVVLLFANGIRGEAMAGEYAAYEGQLEIRQFGSARSIAGTFNYNSTGTVSDRGRVRKERFSSRAFRFAIDQEPDRKIDLLIGHDFGKPIASRQSGSLRIVDADDAVRFEATLPEEALTPSWVQDVLKAIANKTMIGLSPGFRVPPVSAGC